jgi:RNA polymerase sigma-70 factor (ECF subfamily)
MHQLSFRGSQDAGVFSAFYQEHAPQVFTYLRLHLRSKEDAEDLLVEVFLACLESSDFQRLAEPQRRAWLWRVVHHKLIDLYRKGTVRQRVVTMDGLTQEIYYDDDLSPERLMERSEEYRQLHELVKALPHTQQQVLRLRLVHGLRSKEIASRMGKSEQAIRALLSRALNLLRSTYRQQQGEHDD